MNGWNLPEDTTRNDQGAAEDGIVACSRPSTQPTPPNRVLGVGLIAQVRCRSSRCSGVISADRK
jgi:hypothetical protein